MPRRSSFVTVEGAQTQRPRTKILWNIHRKSAGNPAEILWRIRRNSCATVPYRTLDDDDEDARARAKLRLHECYTEQFGTSPTPATVESLCMWLERYPLDVVQEAVHRAAVANPANPLAYMYEILRNWYAGGHRTLLDIQGAEADRDMAQGRI